MNLYFVNVFQVKFSCSLYTLFTHTLNKLEPIWIDKLQSFFNSPFWKYFRDSVIFIFSNVFIGFKSELQDEFFETKSAVRSTSISTSCTTEFMVRFISKYKTLKRQKFLSMSTPFRIALNWDYWSQIHLTK